MSANVILGHRRMITAHARFLEMYGVSFEKAEIDVRPGFVRVEVEHAVARQMLALEVFSSIRLKNARREFELGEEFVAENFVDLRRFFLLV